MSSKVLDRRGIGDLHQEHETACSLLHILDLAYDELTMSIWTRAVGPEPLVQVLGMTVGG
mgnify:FL=1